MTETSLPLNRQNSFGLLRLIFALLVIVSHSSTMLYGDRSHEIIFNVFGTTSFGELSVFGFFLISGYFITQSRDGLSFGRFIEHRVLRIYPAFIVAFALTVFLVAPFAGYDMRSLLGADALNSLSRVFLLKPPGLPAFSDLPYPGLNNPMWTIAYEFRCYLIVGMVGFLPRSIWVPAFWTLLFASIFVVTFLTLPTLPTQNLHGDLNRLAQLLIFFCVGGIFYLHRERIPLRADLAALATFMLIACLFSDAFFSLGFALFGGYLVFFIGFLRSAKINALNNRTDISYGVYLYAWPIQSLAIKYIPGINTWQIATLAFAGATSLGYLSWILVEKPANDLRGHFAPRWTPLPWLHRLF